MTGLPALDAIVALSAGSVRLIALFWVAPVYGHAAVPRRVRVGLAMVFAWVLVPSSAVLPPAPHLLQLGGLVLTELLIGIALGFAVRLLFAAFDLLGEFASVQGGLGAATIVDPTSGQSSLIFASMFQVFMLLVFLAIGGHHDVLRAVVLSFERFPLGGAGPPAEGLLAVARIGASMFEIAVRLAAPITVAMFVSNVAVGILGRSIPQLNLMMLQLPAHVAMTLALVMLGAGAIIGAASDEMERWPARSLDALSGEG